MTALEDKVEKLPTKLEEFYRDKYTEANEAYLSEARRAEDAVDEVRRLRAECSNLRRQIARLEGMSVASSDDDET